MINREGSNGLRKKIEHYSYGLRDFLHQSEGYNVFHGLDESRGERVAIRVVDLRRHPQVKEALGGEIDIIKRLSHPNILHTLDVFSTVNNCYIITELYPDGTLLDRMRHRGSFQEDEALAIFKQIVSGWLYLLKERVIHANLEPAHILLDHGRVTISGFGCSRREGKAPKGKPSFTMYQSPESLRDDLSSFKGDIWSLGTILYVLLHGDYPWKCPDKEQFARKAGKTPLDMAPTLSKSVVDFLIRSLAPVEQRLTEQGFVEHPLIMEMSMGGGLAEQENYKEESRPKNHASHTVRQVEKQITAHHNWMRFLFRLLERLGPQAEEESTKVLKFIVARQVLVQYEELKLALTEGENRLQLAHWEEYRQQRERMANFGQNIDKNRSRYNKALATYKHLLAQLRAKPPGHVRHLLNQNFTLSEYNCMVAIRAALDEIRRLWQLVAREHPTNKRLDPSTPCRQKQLLMAVDFLTSYYQLNCILIEDFQRIDYFEKMSKLDLILEYSPPVDLDASHIYELSQKLLQLEIVKH